MKNLCITFYSNSRIVVMTAKIKLSDSAFFTLLLEGLEAYSIKHQGQKKVTIETHAQLWGTSNKRLPFSCEVKHISVDSSAHKRRDSVAIKPLALELKKDIAAMFGEGYSHLGTFHTHPWVMNEKIRDGDEVKGPSSIRRHKLYNFSCDDHLCECESPTINVGKNKFSIALVMTIFAGIKADDRKDGFVDDSLFEFSLGNVKVWLKAQVYQHKPLSTLTSTELKTLNVYGLLENRDYQQWQPNSVPIPIATKLEARFLNDLGYYLEKFGRILIDGNNSVYRNAKESEKRWLFT